MATIGRAKMAVNDASLIGWQPSKWKKSGGRNYGHGRRKPTGKAYTISAVRRRRKALGAARRRGAK